MPIACWEVKSSYDKRGKRKAEPGISTRLLHRLIKLCISDVTQFVVVNIVLSAKKDTESGLKVIPRLIHRTTAEPLFEQCHTTQRTAHPTNGHATPGNGCRQHFTQ